MKQPEIPELPEAGDPLRDGIEEDDNAIPLWFNVSWWGTWIFGVLYMGYYLMASDWSSAGMYAAEVQAAQALYAEQRANRPDTNPFRGDAVAATEGAETFTTICAACHMPDGRGLVGPSLVDPYWKYGDSDVDKFVSVFDGRPGGMPPWGAQLGEEKVWKVLAFMATLQKSDEPGVGAPNGPGIPGTP